MGSVYAVVALVLGAIGGGLGGTAAARLRPRPVD
jgi:hypothetical protein